MQHVVAEHRRVLVDVVHGQHHGGHNATSHARLGDVTSVREEARDVHVATLVAGQVGLLARREAQQREQARAEQRHLAVPLTLELVVVRPHHGQVRRRHDDAAAFGPSPAHCEKAANMEWKRRHNDHGGTEWCGGGNTTHTTFQLLSFELQGKLLILGNFVTNFKGD